MPISTLLSSTPTGRVVLTHYGPGEECRPHRHKGAQVSQLLAGGYVEVSEEGCREAEGPSFSVKPPRFEHENKFGHAGALILSIHREGEVLSAQGYRVARSSSPHLDMPTLSRDLVGYEALRLAEATPPFFESSKISPSPWVREARQRLMEDPELPVASLARSMGRHPVHLARQFRAAFGRPPSQIRQDDRTARAVDRIVRSSRPLVDIAYDTGFADQAHMTRALKLATGWSPGDLRRLLTH